MKIDKLFTNYDFNALLIKLLETFDDQDRQSILAIFAQAEFGYLKN